MRARELGLRIGWGTPGPHDAITDVAGVRVGHATLVEGADVRTGVSVVLPPRDAHFAGYHRLNGNGELTGLQWVRESGVLTSAIALTNTYSVGVVRDALLALRPPPVWHLPVVGETSDAQLNDIAAMRVGKEHVAAALADASGGPVAEGNVGGGTGMICHGFKGGIGSASRVLPREQGGWTVGVLVQANHGLRHRLAVDGVRVGDLIPPEVVPIPGDPQLAGVGSIIGLVATDAPLLPGGCERLAQRAALGVARTGGAGECGSGDLFLAFSTANEALETALPTYALEAVALDAIDPLFHAVVEATEEAIVNALLAAETMTGRGGVTAHGLDPELLLSTMRSAPPRVAPAAAA